MLRAWIFLSVLIFLPHGIEARENVCSPITEPVHFPLPWRLRHDQQLEKLPTTTDILLIGDSYAALWQSDVWGPLRTFNAGVGGASIEQVLWRVRDPKWRALTPKNVVLFIGSNNHARGDCAFAIIDGVSTILSRMISLWPNARFFVVGIPPPGPRDSLRPSERAIVNKLVEWRASQQGVRYVGSDNLLEYLSADEVHLGIGAYQALTSAIRPLLAAGGAP